MEPASQVFDQELFQFQFCNSFAPEKLALRNGDSHLLRLERPVDFSLRVQRASSAVVR
jgi:hypothetical protein